MLIRSYDIMECVVRDNYGRLLRSRYGRILLRLN